MPFSHRKGATTTIGSEVNNDENARPDPSGLRPPTGEPGGKGSVALGSRAARSEPNEYKMSCQSSTITCNRPIGFNTGLSMV